MSLLNHEGVGRRDERRNELVGRVIRQNRPGSHPRAFHLVVWEDCCKTYLRPDFLNQDHKVREHLERLRETMWKENRISGAPPETGWVALKSRGITSWRLQTWNFFCYEFVVTHRWIDAVDLLKAGNFGQHKIQVVWTSDIRDELRRDECARNQFLPRGSSCDSLK